MDPISQGTLGTTFSQAFIKKRSDFKAATVIGFLGGLAPDLDSLIQSSTDPLLRLEFHRQFTHSLFFIPFGGAFSAFILYYLGFKKRMTFIEVYFYATVGYATHALLDACTSYGTQLLWPFVNWRISWNTISIIDPLFTLPLFLLAVIGIIKRNPLYPRVAILYAFFYMGMGLFQKERAEDVAKKLAKKRGHQEVKVSAKPSFANILLWKTVYENEGRYYVDAIRLGFSKKIFDGESILKLNKNRDMPWLKKGSVADRDVERFRWFSNNYLALDPDRKNTVIDVRYSLLPNQINPLWGVVIDKDNQNKHVDFKNFRNGAKQKAKVLWEMLKGHDPELAVNSSSKSFEHVDMRRAHQ